MREKFDGSKVKQTIFNDLKRFQRFFLDNGEGYAKHGVDSCVDDYSLRPIYIDSNTKVWIKDKH